MWQPSPFQLHRIARYCDRRQIGLEGDLLGGGKDGGVWRTDRLTALKVHDRVESYQRERNAYMRFRDLGLVEMNGHAVPELIDHDDELLAIEMTVVRPPFVVDFASAALDFDPELIEDEGHTIEDMVRERFGGRADAVLGIRDDLIVTAGAWLSDLHPHNIKFASD